MHVDINVMKNSEILSFDIQIVSSDDDNDIKDMMMLSGICQTGVWTLQVNIIENWYVCTSANVMGVILVNL